MEERIISYTNPNQIQNIISTLAQEDFLLVQHSTKTKQLHFKKYSTTPESIITGED